MRFIAIVAIWIVIVGGLASYIHKRDSKIITAAQAKVSQVLPQESFELEITPTFGIEHDPFALTDDTESNPALVIRLNGTDLQYDNNTLQRGESIRINDIHGFIDGNNELFFDASPPLSESHLSHALRIRLYRSGLLTLDKTIWSEAGSKVSGTVPYEPDHDNEEDHNEH